MPAVSYWSATSRHRSKNAGDHALALGPDFEVIDQFLKFSENYTHRLPGLIGEMLSRSISQVLAEASSIGYCLNLTSECDRQLLRDMILKLIETQTSAKLHNIIHLNQDKRVAKPYKELLSKMLALATEQKNPIQQRQIAKPLCGNHPDTPKLLNDIDHRVQELEAYLKAKPRKPGKGRPRKRRAPEPLTTGATNDPGRSAKRIKMKSNRRRSYTGCFAIYRSPGLTVLFATLFAPFYICIEGAGLRTTLYNT